VPQSCERTEGEEPENLEKIEVPKLMRVAFKERTCQNKTLYLVYRCYRVFFISFWFYFLPFAAIIVSYWVQSIYIRDRDSDNE